MARLLTVIVAMGWLTIALGQPDEALLEEQRTAFRAAYGEAERGNWEGLLPHLPLLEDYTLYPDLVGRALRATVTSQSSSRLNAFLAAHPGHPERRLLADAWLRHLATTGQWAEFRHIWRRFGPSQPDRELVCLELQARMAAGDDRMFIADALANWQVGFSQPPACDPVFARLQRSGALTPQRYRARLELALEAKQFQLASYLARQLDAAARKRVDRWRQVYADPVRALTELPGVGAPADARAQALAALTRLAYRDETAARDALQRLDPHYGFSAMERATMTRRAALGKARRHETGAFNALRRVPTRSRDTTVIEWQLRAALRAGLWGEALGTLDELPDQQARSDQWQYWLARSRAGIGDQAAADQVYAALSQNRSLYGFLSADQVGLPYAFDHQPTPVDETRLARLERHPDLRRARELFLVGLFGRGRTLWERTVQTMRPEDRSQAALLAHRWGWHSRAISTAAKAGLYDDLELRYPLPELDWTGHLANGETVDQPYALGVTRSESLFMSDVRSSAGAVGLMQLMPATGRLMARSLNVPYRGVATLTDPSINVRLGTAYLEQMLDQFSAHKVLATAAYNAGPHRVEDWLPVARLPADVWMDSIPFTETRRYVRRVLESEAIVHWRLTGRVKPVSNVMRPVEPTADAGQGAGSL